MKGGVEGVCGPNARERETQTDRDRQSCTYLAGASNIGNNNSDVIKFATIMTQPSILCSSGERCLSLLILCSLECKCCYFLSRNLRPESSPGGINHHCIDLIVVQIVKQSISPSNYNISWGNRNCKNL